MDRFEASQTFVFAFAVAKTWNSTICWPTKATFTVSKACQLQKIAKAFSQYSLPRCSFSKGSSWQTRDFHESSNWMDHLYLQTKEGITLTLPKGLQLQEFHTFLGKYLGISWAYHIRLLTVAPPVSESGWFMRVCEVLRIIPPCAQRHFIHHIYIDIMGKREEFQKFTWGLFPWAQSKDLSYFGLAFGGVRGARNKIHAPKLGRFATIAPNVRSLKLYWTSTP